MLNRPKIICHMLMSVDGKVTGRFLNNTDLSYANEYYYEINRNSNSSFLCGRVTMEEIFTQGYYPNLEKYKNIFVPKGDYISYEKGVFFAIAIDPSGKLGWRKNKIEDSNPGYNGKTIIEVLTEKAPKEYLAYLRSINISYILCGEEIIDLKLALKKLYHGFGINKILIQGGSKTNSEFINLNLVDELSLVVAPVISEKNTKPLFDSNTFTKFQLESVETKRDIIHLFHWVCRRYIAVWDNLTWRSVFHVHTPQDDRTEAHGHRPYIFHQLFTAPQLQTQDNKTDIRHRKEDRGILCKG